MIRAGDLGIRESPFHAFICDGCNKALGAHFQFRPDKLADVVGGVDSRKADGRLYCHEDQSSYAGAYHQRDLRRTMVDGYSLEHGGKRA